MTLFPFLTRLLIAKHLKLLTTYLGRNVAIWETCFSAPQNAKKNELKHKNQVPNRHFMTVWSRSMKDYTCHYGVSTWKLNVYINFIKITRISKIFYLHVTGYLNAKKTFPTCRFLLMNSWNRTLHINFTFVKNSKSHTYEFI